MTRTVVIGSGFGGLAAAVRMAARGHAVTLIEKRERAGGRAAPVEVSGFRFDGGPTVITAPFLFEELFALAGRRLEDAVRLIPVEPFYRIFDARGRWFEYNGSFDDVARQIERWNPDDVEGYRRFLEASRAIFQKGFVELADAPFLNVTDMLRVAPDLVRLQSYRSVYGFVSKFIRDPFLRRCFTFHPLLIGGNPFVASSIYAMIHHLEREWGVWYAEGGTGALVDALVRLFEELGGRLWLGREVRRIRVEGRRAVAVELADGEVVPADRVICNGDVPQAYLSLVAPEHRGWRNSDLRYRKLTAYSMSLFVVYFGTDRLYRDTPLVHHNIILSERYKGLIRDIFRARGLPRDFSLYVHMPTLTDPSGAPPGHEAFYALSPVPHLGSPTDWERMAPRYRELILEFLERGYLPGLRAHIVAEHTVDPRHFRDNLNTYLGTGFSVQPTLWQSAWFRPHNRSEDIDNLYFVGAGTHPGAGVPGVLSSAKVVERIIAEEEGR